MPDQESTRRPGSQPSRGAFSPGALEHAQAGQLRLVYAALQNVGPARVLAVIATLDEQRPVIAVLRRLRELADEDTGTLGQPRRPDGRPAQASLTLAAGYLEFAIRQFTSAVTAAGLVVPQAVAEALMVVEEWIREITPPPPGP
jgi:hypothetical protein